MPSGILVYWKSFGFFSVWKKGRHCSADLEMNRLRAATRLVSFWTSPFLEHLFALAYIFSGLALISQWNTWIQKTFRKLLQMCIWLDSALSSIYIVWRRSPLGHLLTPGDMALDQYTINADIHVAATLVLKNLVHQSLVGCSYVFQAKWH